MFFESGGQKGIMSSLSFKEASEKFDSKEIVLLVKSKENTVPYVSKIVGSILFALLVSLPAVNYYAIFPICAFVLLSILLFKYITSKPMFKVLNYNWLFFLVWQTAAIFFMVVFLRVKADSYHLIPAMYIILGYVATLLLIRARVHTYLKEEFESHSKSKSNNVSRRITKIIGVFLIIIIMAIFFYRGNKWWIMNMTGTFDNQSFLVYAVWGIVLLTLLIGFTLLPTLLFSPAKYVRGKLVKKYSEEFRKHYGFTENEWYGEK
ncbi:hypothetical protein [Listeria goaensis]|uniref:hypothetical protein n=1 Tax=Listeria goaensis TaxID=1649188 RepID=UPI00196834DD|nr:hypothetical protein [Listeria goaensis]